MVTPFFSKKLLFLQKSVKNFYTLSRKMAASLTSPLTLSSKGAKNY